jgi:hypothetical protein
MFDAQFANFYAVLTVLGIVVLLWVVISKWQMPAADNAHLLSVSQENLTGISAFLLAGSSVALSIGFAIVLSFHPILTVVFVSMFCGFALVEFISSFHLSRAWNQRRIGGVMFSIWMMIGGVAISILAGQSLLQIAESNAKAERLKKNAEYEAFLARKEYANQRVQELAITDSEVQTAKTALATLLVERERVQKLLDACPRNHITLCIKPNTTKLSAIEEKIANQNAVIKRGNEYQAARQVANELNSTPIDAVPGANESSPGIEALALVLRSEAKVVGAFIFLALAIFCELSALIAFYLWGQSRFERSVSDKKVYEYYYSPPPQPMAVPANGIPKHEISQQNDNVDGEPHANGRAQSEAGLEPNSHSNDDETHANGIPQNDETHANGSHSVAQNDKEIALYDRLEKGVKDGELTNLSFPKLREYLGIKNNSLIGKLRDRLVLNGLAVYDSTRKCIPTGV